MRGRMPRKIVVPHALYAKELLYIESSGTQYINTGVVPTANTRFVVGFRMASPSTANEAVVSAVQFSFRYYGANSCFRSNSSNQVDFSTAIDASAYHTAEKSATGCTIDGTYSVTNTAGSTSYPLFAFAHNASGTASNFAKVKIYSLKIYENNVLVRDYIPVLDHAGVACLYDKVTKELYYNAGSGAFSYGEAA